MWWPLCVENKKNYIFYDVIICDKHDSIVNIKKGISDKHEAIENGKIFWRESWSLTFHICDNIYPSQLNFFFSNWVCIYDKHANCRRWLICFSRKSVYFIIWQQHFFFLYRHLLPPTPTPSQNLEFGRNKFKIQIIQKIFNLYYKIL